MSSTDTAVAVSAARHAVHELLVELPSWDADDAREAISRLEQAIEQHVRAQVAEPIVARWSKGVTHHDAGTTVECVDADDPLRGIALELTLDDREALGLMLVDPDGEMDQADDERDAAVAQLAEIRRVAVRMGTQYTYQEPDGDQYERGQFHTAQRLWETLLRMERQHPVPGLGSLRAQLADARQADDTTSKEAWPVTMRLFGGKVVHAARFIPDSGTGVYATACGEADKPGTGGGIVDCDTCIDLLRAHADGLEGGESTGTEDAAPGPERESKPVGWQHVDCPQCRGAFKRWGDGSAT